MANSTGLTRAEFLVILVILAALLSLIVPAILTAREAARESTCIGKMYLLKTGMEKYRSFVGGFPEATFVDPNSNQQHSWRMLILPHVSSYTTGYRWDQSWNSPHSTGPGATFADNKFYRLSGVISESDLRALLTRAAADSPKRAELDKKDGTFGR